MIDVVQLDSKHSIVIPHVVDFEQWYVDIMKVRSLHICQGRRHSRYTHRENQQCQVRRIVYEPASSQVIRQSQDALLTPREVLFYLIAELPSQHLRQVEINSDVEECQFALFVTDLLFTSMNVCEMSCLFFLFN